MAARNTYTFKLTAEGVEALERQLKGMGAAGQAAFEALQRGAPQLEDAFTRAQKQVEEARKKIAAANDDVPKGFAKVGAAAEALDTQAKKATRGLNDVRGTLELLGPLAGEAGGMFGGLVRTVGNVGDAFGVLASIVSKNPMAIAITAGGLLAAALVGVTVKTYDAVEAQKKYETALKAQDAILRTTAEKNEQAAAAKKEEATQAALVSLKIEQENLARLERLRLRQREAELDAGMAGSPGADIRGSRETEMEIVRTNARIAQIRGQMQQVEEKSEDDLRAEREAKIREHTEKVVAFETARAEESVQRSEEEAQTRVEVDEAEKAKRLKIEKDFSEAQQRLAEEDAKVQLETSEALNRQVVANQEKLEREVFGAGAQRAVSDYWESLQQHGKRAQQFVSSSVLRPMEDSLAKFFATGKGKISDFFDAVKMGLARLAAQEVIGGIGAALGIGGGGSVIAAGGKWLSNLFFAEGGRPRVGQWAVVGERGPELIKFDQAARVYSNDDSRSMLRQAETLGRGGDTILAHINEREARLLRAMGGKGTRNPRTGLLEFTDSGQGDGPAGDAPDTGPGGVGPGAGQDNYGYGWDNETEVTSWDDYGERSRGPGSPRGIFGNLDDRVVAAFEKYGINVSSRVSQGLAPGFGDYLSDFFGIGNPTGFFGSRGAGLLGKIGVALLGLPALAAFALNTAVGFGRSAATGGGARGTGVGGFAYDVAVLGMNPLDRLGESISNLDRSLGLDGSRNFGGTASAGRFGGFDVSASQLAFEGLTMGGSARAAAARGDLAADLGDLRGSLSGSWADVQATGRGIMASAPRFHQGGSFTVGGVGEQPVAFVAQAGEKVTVKTPQQQESFEALMRLTAAGFEMLREEIRALRADIGTLGRRLQGV